MQHFNAGVFCKAKIFEKSMALDIRTNSILKSVLSLNIYRFNGGETDHTALVGLAPDVAHHHTAHFLCFLSIKLNNFNTSFKTALLYDKETHTVFAETNALDA